MLNAALLEEVVTTARQLFEQSGASRTDDWERRRRELKAVELEQARLTDAIAAGANVPAVIARLRTTERHRLELLDHLNAGQTSTQPHWREIEKRIRQSLTDWRSLLTGDVAQVRSAFRQLLTTPIVFTPFVERGRRGIRFEGRIGLASILGGEVVTKLASPAGSANGCTANIIGVAA